MGIIINENLEKYRKYIKKNLNDKRYIHSLGVCYTCASLAMRYCYNIENAQIAGILHDCAKNIKGIELINACKNSNIYISEFEKDNAELLHAKYGKYIAENELNIHNNDILDAILYHTTGRPNMNLLEKIVFVADYIEPSRTKLDNLDDIRKMAFIDIDKCILMICENTINYLKNKNAVIDDITVKTYDYYKNKEK